LHLCAMDTRIATDLFEAQSLLKSGKLVAIPTETVYGLAANALNADAVIHIFETKNRPHFDPLIVHVASHEQVADVAIDISEAAHLLMRKLWPGPLTIVLRKHECIPHIVTSGLDTLGVRMPDHPLTLELLRSLNFPLAAPSANPFGYISPTSALHVAEQLGERIPYILDGGECRVGVESTIIDCTTATPTILRLGGTSVETIQELIGEVNVNAISTSAPQAPGMLHSHYAPRKPLLVGNIHELLHEHGSNVSILSFKDSFHNFRNIRLSETGDLHEAARNLFAAMRKLDADHHELIIAEFVPDFGLGRAINDRLKRAAAK
jgi:L-threonylcarbamoyladenylate synthase